MLEIVPGLQTSLTNFLEMNFASTEELQAMGGGGGGGDESQLGRAPWKVCGGLGPKGLVFRV